MSVNVHLIAEVDAAFREARGLPRAHALTDADYGAFEAACAQWVAAGGSVRLLTGKSAPNRSIYPITNGASKQRASYIFKDKKQLINPASVLPDVCAFLAPS